MTEVLLLGLVLGLHHALEADHVAAIASLVARERRLGRILRHGTWWSIGHALTLSLVVGGALLAGGTMPAAWGSWLEGAVGSMLVGLGLHLIYRLHKEHVHVHAHTHEGAGEHLHIHSHRFDRLVGERKHHAALPHRHEHRHPISFRALFVGMTHGLAGSAALLVITVAAMRDLWGGLAYVALFSLGTITGMIGLCALMSLPLSYVANRFQRWHRLAQAVVASTTVFIGADLVLRLWV